MPLARRVAEFLLGQLLSVTRLTFIGLALALLSLAALYGWAGAAGPAWAVALGRSTVLAGIAFLCASVLLVAAGRLVPRARPPAPVPGLAELTGNNWVWILGPVLLGLAVGAIPGTVRLIRLGEQLLVLLDRAGLGREIARAGEFSGLIAFPVLLVLSGPIAEAAAALFLTVGPALLLALFVTKSSRFRRYFLMTAVCQVTLVLAGLWGGDLLSGLVAWLSHEPIPSTDLESQRVLAGLQQWIRSLSAVGKDLALLAAGHCLLLPWVLFSRHTAAAFPPE